MDADQFDRISKSLNRVAAAMLATSVVNAIGRKPTLKEIQTAFNDCYMIVDPESGTEKQEAFQARIDKKEW